MIIYLIINDIHSIYFPYFRLFLNYLLVDESMVQQQGRRGSLGGNRTGTGGTLHSRPYRKRCMARRVFPQANGSVPQRHRTNEETTAETDKHDIERY